MTWLVGVFLTLARIRWHRGQWVQGSQHDYDVIPQYVLVGFLMLWFLCLAILAGMAGWGVLSLVGRVTDR